MSDGKKKKITKAERLKQLQEEEEKRLKEEEEARLKHEKEELERLELKRVEKEKWQKLEAKDRERRNEELEELYFLESCYPKAEKLKRDIRVLSRWKHYVQCDGTPDPSVPQEVNTFISLWKEETNETFEEVIKKSKLVLNLIEKLKSILLETPSYDLQEKNIEQYQGSILELQELLHLKFNTATEILLRQASTLADLDSGNMEKIIKDDCVTLYVWANLKKNARYKSIRFSETQIGFEIPKILATSDIALRLLHTHYDHVTPLPPAPAPPDVAGAPATPEPGKDEEQSAEPAAGAELQEGPAPGEESHTAGEDELRAEEDGGAEGRGSFVQEEAEATKYQMEMKLLSETVIAAQLLLVKNAHEKPEYFEENEVDLCQFTVLGGVYHLDILELPPQYKPVKGWMMVEIPKGGLQKYVYPPETTEDFETENVFPPIEVMLQVHENVIFFEEPMVARWDSEGKRWRTDGIRNVSYNSEERLVTFSLEAFGPVTLIQDSHINMPYLSWELRPLQANEVLLTMTTVFTELQIQIKENLCTLASIKLKNKEHFSILQGKWMTPITFATALKEVGLNIFPTSLSHFYVVVNNKVPMVEMKAYRQMALLSCSFAFSWSKWNVHCDSNKVIFKVAEHLSEEPIPPSSWDLLLFTSERAQRLKITEYSQAYSEALKAGTEFHSNLFHLVKDFSSEAAIEKVRSTNCLLIDSVCQMLLSIRLLSYS
ncbi:dynein axonemal intermediate chain 7 isoform X2 [Dasypus novemcinctus]|uniref:dynein axonemal intermediate chain 7 isoform X2 n=1 Tax=Dasypus novemcinctus TaxID=9361 RepID=UPI000328FB82|nr:dynein axonemal intermediate chain 7 isoform X2 [Dasypus novemcinctus]